MTVRYRNPGFNGPGLGRRLTSLEVDENFDTLETRIQNIIDNPIPGLGIANIAMVGTRTLRVTLDDNSIFEFFMPVVAPHWRGEWQANTAYFALDRFSKDGFGIYVVLFDHISGATFDENATEDDTDGTHDLYYKEFGVPGIAASVHSVSQAVYTLELSRINHFIMCKHSSGCEITIPPQEDVNIPVGSEYHFFGTGVGPLVVLEGDSSVFIWPVSGFIFQTPGPGRPITLKKVGSDEWVVFGGLAQEASA